MMMDEYMTDSPSTPLSREERLREIGKRLYEARQAKNISTSQVAGNLNFSVSQVKGLESGDWSVLPDQVYGLGFLRQYATYLGVDIHDDIHDLKSAVSFTQPLTIPDPAVAPTRRWAWAALLLFIALAVYYNLQGVEGDGMASLLPNPPTLAVNNAPPSVVIPAPSPVSKTTDTVPATVEPAPSVEAKAVPTVEPKPAVIAQDTYSETAQITSTHKADAVAHHVLFSANGGDVWLRLNAVGADGRVAAKLKETLLRDGQEINFATNESQILFTAGNALNLTITVDDRVIHTRGSLGQNGKVLRNMPLNL